MAANELSVSGTLASSLISAPAASPSAQAVVARNPSANESSRQGQQASPVDSVTILNKLQDTKRESGKQGADAADSNQARTMQSIQFAYNNKGDLRIKFTDSHSKLVYQTPPVYFTRMSDLMERPELSINTKV